jgi:hypothetical protein
VDDADSVAVGVPVPVCVPVCVGVCVAVPLGDREAVGDMVLVAVPVCDGVAVADSLPVPVPVPLPVCVGVAVGVHDPLTLTVPVPLPLCVALTVELCDPVIVELSLGDGDTSDDAETAQMQWQATGQSYGRRAPMTQTMGAHLTPCVTPMQTATHWQWLSALMWRRQSLHNTPRANQQGHLAATWPAT